MLRALRCSVLVLFVTLAPALGAQQKSVKPVDPTAELTRLENDWATGLVKRDRALFERLLAPGFVYTENDKLSQREAVLHDVADGSDTVTAAHNEGMTVHTYRPTTSIVTGWLIVRGRSGGKPFVHRYRFTDTWVKGSAGWQIVAAQDYLAPK